MTEDTFLPSRRKVLLGTAVVILATGAGLRYCGNSFRIAPQNIEEMKDEFAMLQDVALRRRTLSNRPLVIKNADFRLVRLDDVVWENTQFIGCWFYPGSFIKADRFKDVYFERCQFMDCRLSAARWENVRFRQCKGREQFTVLGGGDSKNVVFEQCDFKGVTQAKQETRTDYFGTIGAFGDIAFIDCDLQFVEIVGETHLTIKDCRIKKGSTNGLRENGVVHIENTTVKEYLNLGYGILSSVTIKNSHFDYLDMASTQVADLLIEDCKGQFDGRGMKIRHAMIRNSTFHAAGEPDNNNVFLSAFNMIFTHIQNLTIENIKWTGRNGHLLIGGKRNVLYDKKDPETGGPINFATIEKLTVKNTSLKNGYLSCLQATDVEIENCDIIDVNFKHSEFGRLKLKNVMLAGEVDFSQAIINEVQQENVTRRGDLKLIKDGARASI